VYLDINMSTETTTTVNMEEFVGKRFLAKCKWFNNKLGYGFVTLVCDDDNNKITECDVFCHHSNVNPQVSTFKTLTQGEYVSLEISRCEDNSQSGQEFQAMNVTGVGGGHLFVDTRAVNQQSRQDNGGRGGRGRGGRGGRGRGGF